MNDQEIQQRVISLRAFYMRTIRYIGLNFVGILIWMLSGGGYFWPIWVIVLWGLDIAYEANKLDLFQNKQHYQKKLADITSKWEEKQINQLKKTSKK